LGKPFDGPDGKREAGELSVGLHAKKKIILHEWYRTASREEMNTTLEKAY